MFIQRDNTEIIIVSFDLLQNRINDQALLSENKIIEIRSVGELMQILLWCYLCVVVQCPHVLVNEK